VDVSRHARADLLAEVARLPLRGGSVDGILAKDILEHLVAPWEAVGEFHRVLAKGGRLRVEVPTPHYRKFWDDYTHVRPYTARAVRELLRDQSFEVTRVSEYCAQGLPGFGKLGAEGAAMAINGGLARIGLRKPTNLVGEAVRA
jgi:ubiquinone/menaquinone biosynthesis C-methylase UbiE